LLVPLFFAGSRLRQERAVNRGVNGTNNFRSVFTFIFKNMVCNYINFDGYGRRIADVNIC
jgi:hypothetical protein